MRCMTKNVKAFFDFYLRGVAVPVCNNILGKRRRFCFAWIAFSVTVVIMPCFYVPSSSMV